MADKERDRASIEQAHYRADDHERRIGELKGMADKLPAMVHGAVEALHAGMKAEMAHRDEDFKALLSELREFIAVQKADAMKDAQVVERLDRLIEVLGAPSVRESTINLPSGPVTMTVRERKN
jgi:hypothetical protein